VISWAFGPTLKNGITLRLTFMAMIERARLQPGESGNGPAPKQMSILLARLKYQAFRLGLAAHPGAALLALSILAEQSNRRKKLHVHSADNSRRFVDRHGHS
jgi:hypothetical protein